MVTSRPELFALQASKAGLEEVAVAELFLGQVVMVVDHLVVELPGVPCVTPKT